MSGLKATKRLQLRDLEGRAVVAQDVHLAPLSLSVRALHIDQDVRPRQLCSHLIIGERTAHRRLDRSRAVPLARLTPRVPPVEIRAHGAPVAGTAQNLKTFSGRPVRVERGSMRVLEKPPAPRDPRRLPFHINIRNERNPKATPRQEDFVLQDIVLRVEAVHSPLTGLQTRTSFQLARRRLATQL